MPKVLWHLFSYVLIAAGLFLIVMATGGIIPPLISWETLVVILGAVLIQFATDAQTQAGKVKENAKAK